MLRKFFSIAPCVGGLFCLFVMPLQPVVTPPLCPLIVNVDRPLCSILVVLEKRILWALRHLLLHKDYLMSALAYKLWAVIVFAPLWFASLASRNIWNVTIYDDTVNTYIQTYKFAMTTSKIKELYIKDILGLEIVSRLGEGKGIGRGRGGAGRVIIKSVPWYVEALLSCLNGVVQSKGGGCKYRCLRYS